MIFLRFFSKPWFSLSVIVLLGLLIAVLIFSQVDRFRHERQWVTHTYVVLQTIDEMLLKATQAESSQRRFMLDRDPISLVPFQTLTGQGAAPAGQGETIKDKLDQLAKLTADNTSQQTRIETLRQAVAEKSAFMNEAVEFGSGRLRNEDRKFSWRAGLELMARIQDIAQAMMAEEQRLLEIRTRADSHASDIVIFTSLGLGALLLLVLGSALLAINGELGRRRQAEQELRQTNGFQEALLRQAPYAIIATDPQGLITLFNPAAEEMLGYSAAEMVGRNTPALIHDPDEVRERAAQLSLELGRLVKADFEALAPRNNDHTEQGEWIFRRKDGSSLQVQVVKTSIPDGKGGIRGYLGMAEDITERKKVERMKNEFVSTVSHELRTPLTSIRGSLSLVLAGVAGPLTDKVQNLIGIAHNNSERLVRLINDILDIEKIESGTMIVDLRPVPVEPVLQQIIDENTGYAEKYDVRLTIDARVENQLVEASRDHLIQVLTNLLSNAVKFSPAEATVTLAAEALGDRLIFRVSDTGPGIPLEFQTRIFEKFSQADSSSTREKNGTGLGLSISKALVEKMNGVISFTSVPGHTEFQVTLQQAFPEETGRIAPMPSSSSQKSVLILEDDADIANLLQIILSNEGLDCHIAHNAAVAKQMLAERSFSVMTLDLELPDQDGLSVLKELRKDNRTAELPIIIISVQAEDGQKIFNGHAIGVLDWLQKPIDIARLQTLIRSLVTLSAIPSIIHVEDNKDMVDVIAMSLQDTASVTHASTLQKAREILGRQTFDLAILDIKLDDGSGLDLLPMLMEHSPPTPVIILSASETPREVREKVQMSLVKSVISEEKIAETIRQAIRNGVGRWKS